MTIPPAAIASANQEVDVALNDAAAKSNRGLYKKDTPKAWAQSTGSNTEYWSSTNQWWLDHKTAGPSTAPQADPLNVVLAKMRWSKWWMEDRLKQLKDQMAKSQDEAVQKPARGWSGRRLVPLEKRATRSSTISTKHVSECLEEVGKGITKWADIGKFGAEHGVQAVVRRYSRVFCNLVNKSTVRQFKRAYLVEQAMRRRAGDDELIMV